MMAIYTIEIVVFSLLLTYFMYNMMKLNAETSTAFLVVGELLAAAAQGVPPNVDPEKMANAIYTFDTAPDLFGLSLNAFFWTFSIPIGLFNKWVFARLTQQPF